jgi:hypothetical protein
MADSSVETGQAQGVVVSSNAAENVQLTNNGQGAGGDSGSIVGGASQDVSPDQFEGRSARHWALGLASTRPRGSVQSSVVGWHSSATQSI